MRKSIAGLMVAWTLASPAAAQQFTSPIDLVETLYDSYFSGLPIDDFDPYLSTDLTSQMAGKVGVAEFAVLGFDPIVGEPDWDPRNFTAKLLELEGDKARVEVRFISRGMPVAVTLTLILEQVHGWQIDHIAGLAGERTWCTNDIVALKPIQQPPVSR